MTPFWYAWPASRSWLVELGGGLLAAALAQLPYVAGVAWYSDVGAIVVATALSFVYERWIDRNGFSWADIGQRSPGILLGVLIGAGVRA